MSLFAVLKKQYPINNGCGVAPFSLALCSSVVNKFRDRSRRSERIAWQLFCHSLKRRIQFGEQRRLRSLVRRILRQFR